MKSESDIVSRFILSKLFFFFDLSKFVPVYLYSRYLKASIILSFKCNSINISKIIINNIGKYLRKIEPIIIIPKSSNNLVMCNDDPTFKPWLDI